MLIYFLVVGSVLGIPLEEKLTLQRVMIVNFQCFLSYVLQNNYNHKQISSLVGRNWEVLMPLYQVTVMLFKIVVSRPLRLHAEVQSRSPLAE